YKCFSYFYERLLESTGRSERNFETDVQENIRNTMIIKILSSTGTFAGVKYNTDKMKNEKGELMKVANMPHVDGLNISESECKDYFIAHSSVNKKVKNAQFHAVISADG